MSEKLISSINNSGIYAKVAGTALNAVQLEDILSSNSANWDGTYTTVSQNSASWGQGGDTSNCYPLTGGNLKGQITASGAGGASTSQSAPVYGKITATNKQNQAGLMTNGSVFAGDYNGTASQTIAVRRSAADSALAGRFQLYSDGAVSFQQIYNNGTTDSIVCQLQYGQTNTGFNWGTMASGTTVKHIAFTEDLTGQGKTYTGLYPVVVDNTTETGRISLTTSPITVDSTMTAYESAGNLVLGCVPQEPIVTHDNTLKGNGTSGNPIGLNETVLYDINGGTSQPASFTLSESMRNFEFVRVTVLHGASAGIYETGWGEMFTYPGIVKRMDVVLKAADGSNYLIFDRQYFNTSDGITITRGNKQRHQLNASSVTSSSLSTDFVIIKIVGVNRIQS